MPKIICSNPDCRKSFGENIDIHFESIEVDLGIFSLTCPYCHKTTPLGEGRVNFDEKGIGTLLRGPEFTPAVLSKILRVSQVAYTHRYDLERYRKEITKVGVPPIFLDYLKEQMPDTFLEWLLLLIPFLYNHVKKTLDKSKERKKEDAREREIATMRKEIHDLRRKYHRDSRGKANS